MENEKSPNVSYGSEGVPTIYCNIANVTVSFSDLRLYLAEMSPKTIIINPDAHGTVDKSESLVSPKLSVVMSPEFAKSVGDAILASVAKYEEVFGQLRPVKTQEQVTAALQSLIKK
jgi:hypothetical protein